ncbi:MAG: hypothetical protein ACLVHS_04790 [Blautia wexlerae]
MEAFVTGFHWNSYRILGSCNVCLIPSLGGKIEAQAFCAVGMIQWQGYQNRLFEISSTDCSAGTSCASGCEYRGSWTIT